MKIKTRLIISTILIPVFCGALIGLIGSWFLDSTYIYSLNEYFEDENAVVSAQSTIYSYQKELWNTNWRNLEDLWEGKQEHLEGMELEELG